MVSIVAILGYLILAPGVALVLYFLSMAQYMASPMAVGEEPPSLRKIYFALAVGIVLILTGFALIRLEA